MSWGTTGPITTIYIFDIEGNLINNFGCFGTKNGLFHRIQGITVGACGNIYAVDPYLGRVSVFDDNGNYTLSPQYGEFADVIIKSLINNGDTLIESKRLRIKNLGKVYGTINGIGCGIKCEVLLPKEELKEENLILLDKLKLAFRKKIGLDH